MLLNQYLKSWYSKFQKYKVKYKDGFFHLSNLANSPQTMVESFDKMAFVKHSREKKQMTSNTLFLNVWMQYAELEEGLWIIVSEMKIKKNMVMHNIFDEKIPLKYNFINLHYNQKSITNKSMLVDGMLLTDKTWTVFKAGGVKFDYHFKDAHEYNITIYFTDEWVTNTFKSRSYFKGSNFEKFLNSKNTYVFLTDTNKNSDEFYKDFVQLIRLNVDNSKNNEIKVHVIDFFEQFIEKYDLEPVNEHHFRLSDKDRKFVQKAEKYLLDNLLEKFPGIDAISHYVGVSPTKLKSDFKTIHSQSLYNYYRYHQMHLASKLLSEKASTVKEVANLLGYENASKFSAVFKEQFGELPSLRLKKEL